MSLKAQITDEMKNAMRARDKVRLETIRLIQASIKQVEVDQGKRDEGLSDAEILAVLDKMVKQRRDSVEQFNAGGRADLAGKEQAEIIIIQEFLPQALTEAEIDQLIADTMKSVNAIGMADMGKVMAEIKPQIQGRADASVISAKVKAALAK